MQVTRGRMALVAVVVMTMFAAGALADDAECTVTDESGNTYDLSSLTRTGKQADWVALDASEQNQYTYRINVCKELQYKGYNSSVTIPAGTGVHQERNDAPMRQHVVGKAAFYPTISDGIVVLEYTDGELCTSIGKNRRAVISLICSSGLGQPIMLFEDDCDYFFEWQTSAACAQKLSGLAIFMIVLASLFGAYLVLGVLFMRYVRHARGWEQIPNYAFWALLFSAITCQRGSSSSTNWNYSTVSRDDDGGNIIDNIDDDFDDDAVEKP